MSWLYGQTWLWYLIAFLVGLVLAWLVFVRPAQRRLTALLSEPTDARGARDRTAAAVGTAPPGRRRGSDRRRPERPAVPRRPRRAARRLGWPGWPPPGAPRSR